MNLRYDDPTSLDIGYANRVDSNQFFSSNHNNSDNGISKVQIVTHSVMDLGDTFYVILFFYKKKLVINTFIQSYQQRNMHISPTSA